MRDIMRDIFDEELYEVDILESEELYNNKKNLTLDARRRLECLLEEKRLRDELEDFI